MEKLTLTVGFVLCALFVLVFVKKYAQTYAVPITIVTSVAVMLFILPNIGELHSGLVPVFDEVDSSFLKSTVKILMLAFVGQWGASVCRDAGETALAQKCELAAKVIIGSVSVTYISELIELVKSVA